MSNTERQLAIISAILALICDIPLMALLTIWSVMLICTIGNKKTFCNVLKAMALTSFIWVIGIVLAYCIMY